MSKFIKIIDELKAEPKYNTVLVNIKKRKNSNDIKYISFIGKNSKNCMKEFSKKSEQPVLIQFLNKQGHRNFTCFKSWDDAFVSLPKFGGKRFAYEIIDKSKPCKPYLDLEKVYNKRPSGEELIKFIKQLKTDIIKIFKKDYGLTIKKSNVLILDSSAFIIDKKIGKRYFKLSFHVVINTKKPQILFKPNVKGARNSAFHLAYTLCQLKPEYNEIIDLAVYSKDREMRLVYSYKTNKDDRRLVPYPYVSSKKDTDYVITYINSADSFEYIVPTTKINYDKITKKIIGSTGSYTNIKIKQTMEEFLVNIVKQRFHKSAFLFETKTMENGKTIYSFNYTNRYDPCTIGTKNQYHDQIGFYGFFDNNGLFRLKCRSNKCEGISMVVYNEMIDKFFDDSEEVDINENKKDIKIDEEIIMDNKVEKKEVKNVDKIAESFFDDIDTDKKMMNYDDDLVREMALGLDDGL